ncbi:MAG: FAD-dependent oxidoreductase [Deltaproteobacteria bacterium]|nr:FAD-dependent oxidoreductase [Deltaproteobacteria bacterium]
MSHTISPVPEHNDDKCRVCRICWNQCPAEVLPELREEKDTLRGIVYSTGHKKGSGPRAASPCQAACPLKQDVSAYIAAIVKRDYEEALRIIRLTNPLPRVLGDICEHPCTKACTRGSYDNHIDIRGLKRFAARMGTSVSKEPPPFRPDSTGMKIAVVGAGPAGLAASYNLALKGHDVTIFDSEAEPGGLLRYAVPGFLLSREDLSSDIEYIMELGVNFKPSTKVGRDIILDSLMSEYDAVLLSTGAGIQGPTRLYSHDTADGIVSGLELSRQLAAGKRPDLGSNVAVVGGFPEGLACARSALRLGAREVRLVTSGKLNKIPLQELILADEEGVIICAEHIVQGLEYDNGLVLNLNRSGPDSDEALSILCDTVVIAQGRTKDLSCLSGLNGNKGWPTPLSLDLNKKNMALSNKGLFAAGEAVTGPKSTVRAVASGLKAAAGIDSFLSGQR